MIAFQNSNCRIVDQATANTYFGRPEGDHYSICGQDAAVISRCSVRDAGVGAEGAASFLNRVRSMSYQVVSSATILELELVCCCTVYILDYKDPCPSSISIHPST